MTTRKTVRGVRALAATLGAAVLASLGLAGTALAADTSLIDPDAKGSVHITKYKGDSGVEANGEEVTTGLPGDDQLLGGATFTLYRVDNGANDYDVAKNQGWTAIAELLREVGPNPSQTALTAKGLTLTPAGAQTTDEDGVADFTGLDLGLYYAVETAPAGYQPVSPFLFTVPMTNSTGDGWNYDIYLYPKDAEGSTKIPLDGETVNVGDELTWEIKAAIPQNVSYLKVTDLLDENLSYVSTSVVLDGTPLTENTEYTVATSDEGGRTKVIVEFTDPAGITALADATGNSVTINIVTEVKDTFVSGAINNTADIFDNEGSTTPGSSTPQTASKYGEIVVNKTDEVGEGLNGATFDLYWSTTDKFADATKIDAKSGVTTQTVDGKDGVAKFSSLRWSTWANGAEVAPGETGYIYYWLVETQAPNGFQTLAEPVQVALDGDATDVTVVNIEQGSGIKLPFTGGAGTIVFVLAGLALVAGTVLLAVGRKSNKQEA